MREPAESPSPVDLLVERMKGLPTLPDAALEALHLLDDPDYDVRSVAGVISRDPVLALRLVGMGNSPFFCMGMRTSCVKTSILRLGERETRGAILSVAIMNVFPRLPAPLDVRRFWTYGLASAVCGRRLAEDLGYPDLSAAYLGALVHRLGEAFLAVSFPKRFSAAWRRSRSQEVDLDEALYKDFDVYPSELCARVMESWGLPPARDRGGARVPPAGDRRGRAAPRVGPVDSWLGGHGARPWPGAARGRAQPVEVRPDGAHAHGAPRARLREDARVPAPERRLREGGASTRQARRPAVPGRWSERSACSAGASSLGQSREILRRRHGRAGPGTQGGGGAREDRLAQGRS